MTRPIVCVLLAALFFLPAACGTPPPDPEEMPVEEEDEGLESVSPTATTAPEPSTATAEPYPLQPTPTPLGEGGYPAPASPPTAYPVDMRIWILRPLGYQCEENEGSVFASADEAVAALTDAGVDVFASEETNLMVCEACGCPTSAHYRMQILRSDLPSARLLGWVQESR